MTSQFEFHLEASKPEVSDWEVRLLCESLHHEGTWMTASDIIAKHAMTNTEQTRRVLRALAEASNGEIISGQQGYKHNAHATQEERERCVNSFRSQAGKMLERAQSISQWVYQHK